MGLWDVVSGKLYRWNRMKVDVGRQFCQRLSTWHDEFKQRHKDLPNIELVARDLRNRVFAYFSTVDCCLSRPLEGELSCFNPALLALSTEDYIRLVSTAHAAVLTLQFADSPGQLAELLDAIAFLYGRGSGFAQSWLECLDWLKPDSPKNFSGGVQARLGRETDKIPGLGRFGIPWSFMCVRLASGVGKLVQTPDWQRTVEAEISGYLAG